MVTTRAMFKKTQIIPVTTVCSNDDLLTEILRRLPAKPILRFKSVSKQWLSLLSQHHFTLLYDKRLISPGLFFGNSYIPFDVESPSPRPFCSLSFDPDRSGIRNLQSCNGLLLCCSGKWNELIRKFYVYNPTTKQFAVIPSVIGGVDVYNNISFMGLAFDPIDVHFKIVCIYGTNENPNGLLYRIQIYSSETGEWKISHESFSVNYRMFSRQYGVYWNGAIHWLTLKYDAFYFKLDVEQIQSYPLPKEKHYNYFGESRGHLHLVETVNDANTSHWKVYEMLRDHSGWFVKYQVELDELLAAYPEIISRNPNQSIRFYEFKVVDLVRGEKEEDTFMVVRIPKRIIRYNVVYKSFKPISDPSRTVCYVGDVHRYIETIGSF